MSSDLDLRDAAKAIRLRADSLILRLLDGTLDEEVARVADELMDTQLRALELETTDPEPKPQSKEEDKKGARR